MALAILIILISQNTLGQEETQGGKFSPITLNDTTANHIERSLERLTEQIDRIIANQQNDRNSLLSSYVGMGAFLVGLAVVIFGLQLSRGDKISATSKTYYKILILSLILPVVILYVISYIRVDLGEVKDDYLGVASLLMIPSAAVLILMSVKRLREKL